MLFDKPAWCYPWFFSVQWLRPKAGTNEIEQVKTGEAQPGLQPEPNQIDFVILQFFSSRAAKIFSAPKRKQDTTNALHLVLTSEKGRKGTLISTNRHELSIGHPSVG